MRAGGNQTGGDRPYGTDVDTCDSLVVARSLNAHAGGRYDYETETETETLVAHSLRASGFDASEDGTGRGTPLVPVPIAFSCKDYGNDAQEGVTPMLRSMNFDKSHANAGGQLAIAFDTTQITSKENRCQPKNGDPCHPLSAHAHAPALAFHARQDPINGPVAPPLDTDGLSIGIQRGWQVRRLTPMECERLQGFPEGYTAIPYRKGIAADGPRYKALGNSMAVNCMRWIGRRIQMVEDLQKAE